MATSSRSTKPPSRSAKKQANLSIILQQPHRKGKQQKPSASTTTTTTATVKSAKKHINNATTLSNSNVDVKSVVEKIVVEEEEEYEVEAIRDHKWSNQYQEYEYLLKWRGYGEEENSWVPANGMNCWDLLQAYLSKNIFWNLQPLSTPPCPPPSSLSSPPVEDATTTSSSSSPFLRSDRLKALKSKAKVQRSSRSSTSARNHTKSPCGLKDILVSNTLSTSPSKGTLRLSHVSEPLLRTIGSSANSKRASSVQQQQKLVKRSSLERGGGGGGAEKTVLFSTPKHPPSSSAKRLEQKSNSATVASRDVSRMRSRTSQQKAQGKMTVIGNGQVSSLRSPPLTSPSVSPLLSGFDDTSSPHSDASNTSSFQLFLDSDEDSSVSGVRSLNGETPLISSVPGSGQLHNNNHKSPVAAKYRLCSPPPYNHHKKNGLNHHSRSFVALQRSKVGVVMNGLSSSPGSSLQSDQRKKIRKLNGIVSHTPTSTTYSSVENSSDSESWSKRRLRKRAHSSSPTPPPTPNLAAPLFKVSLSRHAISTESGHAEVSSTTSPFLTKSFPATGNLTLSITPSLPQPASLPSLTAELAAVQRQREYQQGLLDWQFILNKQCRPRENFILVENQIDEAPIPSGFKYITSNVYGEGVPNPETSDVASLICGCNCYLMGKKCGPRNQHCCPKMASAEFPYSPAGKIRLPPGTPIYECNSHCSCPLDCLNRVVQRGRKINMCIFRTANGCGWGVKTLEPIKPNTFVTEYVGEVVTTEEAERRGELYDQEGRTYLFDLDFNCADNAFTIDAANYGNISHFFNHSCNPNLRVYSVWIDSLDERLPRIALFSTRSISAGQELTFDYQMNQDEQGQVGCLCGEANCCGYLY